MKTKKSVTGKVKRFVSDHHAPFAEVNGTKFNFIIDDKKHGQWFIIKRGNFEHELRVSKSGRIALIGRRK